MDLEIRQHLKKAKEQQDSGALQSAYRLIQDMGAAVAIAHTPRIAPELYVVCSEAALQLGCLEISAACLKMFFEGNPPANQFVCRALLCQGQLKTPPASGTVEDFEEAVLYFLKAIEISKSEPRYHFIVFNASVLYFQTVRPLLQPGRSRHLVPSFREVVRGLEEVDDQEHSWRAELMMHLIKCLVDSGNMEDATRFAKVTEDFFKSNTPHLYAKLFPLLVQHKLTDGDVLMEMSRRCSTLAVIYKIQEFKKLVEIQENGSAKEKLEQIFCLLADGSETSAQPLDVSPIQNPTPIPPADRVAFLLELAVLALQVKHQTMAADCLKELRLAEEADVGQRIIMECINCEINILKREGKMNDYSKASVEARLKEISRLDQWLQSAVARGGPEAMQAVCCTQWSFCLPLLQHNLRKRVKTPLLRVAQVLEDMQSVLVDMRCQVHWELAQMEEGEGRLEASLTHLRKALQLDDGTRSERLASAVRLLLLRGTLHQTPPRAQDQAAMLLQQARDMLPKEKKDSRAILVAVGLLLAPNHFQAVLDADNISKIPADCLGSGPEAKLSAQAQHHSTSVQKVIGYLDTKVDGTESAERVELWAMLVKTARKQEVWDVCRAAGRFCLLYDDGTWNTTKSDVELTRGSEELASAESLHSHGENETWKRDLLRLLAEIHFISAEATVQMLLMEGLQFNSPAVPPVCVCEEDPHWIVYRDWVRALCAVATGSFLRAAELGAEIREPWLVANSAVYLWNYSSHLMEAGQYRCLLHTFHSLVDMLRKTECTGNGGLLVLLCNAVARGLLPAPAAEKPGLGRGRGEKGVEKAASAHGAVLDPAALQDVRKASELCDYALEISASTVPGEAVPIAARKQLLSTWVQVKRLLQQQISFKMEKEEGESDEVSAMTRVLLGLEMLQCNRSPKSMDFTAPSLSTLVSLASECVWSDAVVELQVWCQLASFCHSARDHRLVLSCTERALGLERAAAKSLHTMPCVLYAVTAVDEMLSGAACLRGLSLVHESNGDLQAYREAMKLLLSSFSYAEKVEKPALCVTAARHYWNTCLPLTHTPEERCQLREPLEKILSALVHTNKKHAKKLGKVQALTTMPPGGSKHEATDEEDLTIRTAICILLLHIHIDKADWKSALQLLDRTLKDMPWGKHRIPLLKHRVLVKARLGDSLQSAMMKLHEEGEQCCWMVWRQVALCAATTTQQLTCYHKAIASLSGTESPWEKVSLLLELGEWLYSHDFPKAEAQHPVQWAIDLLLRVETEKTQGEEDQSQTRDLTPPVGVQGALFSQSLSDLRDVRCLDSLVQAHTLMAVLTDRTSPEHQLNLLRAYSFVVHIWRVSMEVGSTISTEMAKSQSQPPASAESKKDKDKDKGKGKKGKEPAPAEQKVVPMDQKVPSTTKDWARYVCPAMARHIFSTNTNPHCINALSVTNETQSLFYLNLLEKELRSLSLDHLTLPIMHLAETIAHDLLDMGSLSDLYRLRIVRTCQRLGLETHSPYQEQILSLSRIQEQEQMEYRKEIAASCQTRGIHKNQKVEDEKAGSGRQGTPVCAQDIWLDKAEVCLSMGLHQQARQLMAEAHLVSMELGDQKATARSLLSLSVLACEEHNFGQAAILLDKARALGGDEEFWCQLCLTHVSAVLGQGEPHALTKVDQIIKEGCSALKLARERRINRVPELTLLITSLEMRGAVECIKALDAVGPGKKLSTEVVHRLMAACHTLRECASGYTQVGSREQAAEARVEYAQGLRILAKHTSHTGAKQRLLLDGFSQMQLAVSEQEHVVLNTQSLTQEESPGLSLAAMRTLIRLRLQLVDLCLSLVEEHCAGRRRQAVARQNKSPAQIALEEFTHCTPEPDSVEWEWVSTGKTLGQVAVGQLSAVSAQSVDSVETKARCLLLMGKYLRLLAAQEDPLYLCALWDWKQTEAHSEPRAVPAEEDGESSRPEPLLTSAKSAELQRRRLRAQQLLGQASAALCEAVSLGLAHGLPPSVLAQASLNMLECHGQSDPAAVGQHLALFQSCCTVDMMVEVLKSACANTSVSQFSALLHLHSKVLLSPEEPSSMLRGVEDSLKSLSQAFSHLVINPGHLNILAELPSDLNILLLQHSQDGSELYGAFYEMTKAPIPKGKPVQTTGTLCCSRVAKVSVCPAALLALLEQTQAFGQESRQAFLKEACWEGAEGRSHTSDHHWGSPCISAADKLLTPSFRQIVQDMEAYLNPLLTQFALSGFRSASLSDMSKAKDKEDRGSSAALAAEQGRCVVLLVDGRLQQLPLEALALLRDGALSAVCRDGSLQLLHSRISREGPAKVESDNKKETKGGKGTKGKADQSQAIKVVPTNNVLPSNTLPVDTRNFKYIVDPHNEGNVGGTSLSMRMKDMMQTHSHSTHLWEGFMGSKQTPSVSDMERLLCRSSSFMYLGTERFTANIPVDKLPVLDLSECRMALLFDLVQDNASVLRQSNLDMHKSAGQLSLEKPLQTALLLSVAGVGCVALNQWNSSLQQNTRNMLHVMDDLLRFTKTSGQAIHSLRKGDMLHEDTGSNGEELLADSKEDALNGKAALTPSAFCCILYGLPNLIIT